MLHNYSRLALSSLFTVNISLTLCSPQLALHWHQTLHRWHSPGITDGCHLSSLPGLVRVQGEMKESSSVDILSRDHFLPVKDLTVLLQGMKKVYLRPQEHSQAGMSWGLCKQHLQHTEL